MNVEIFVTDKAGLQKFYEAIIAKNETYAPVEKFGKFDFKHVSSLSECDPDSPIEKTMSAKPLFFPRSAKILKYTADSSGTTVKETDEDPLAGKRVILGMKHCDARGLQVLDKVYNWDYIDSDYQKRRQNTVVISTRCDKAETHCFCTSLDYDVQNLDAMDVLIVKGQDGKIFIKARTEKGEDFLKSNPIDSANSKQHPASEEEMKKQYDAFAASFRLKMNYKEINENLSKIFDTPEFENVSSNCIGCNTCAFICPTCHCFKISDEKIKDSGVRYKCYDSCNNGYFTLMAGGHNPRPAKYRRWRQRAMHKFVYYKERFGENLCVGCGRCTISCPVNISIFEVVNQVAKSEK
ncbi:MAG: 4Fe-4S dicluster domain-containing protein [Bacteroidales bacterium]|nr:4Fe-4S dicluster domain-containing protein [Bacteroidales bacterium]